MIPIEKLIRSKRKTLSLIVGANGTLTVRAPLRMKIEDIRRFIESKSGWIERKQAEARKNALIPHRYVEGETLLYLGREIPLRLVPDQQPALILDGSFKLAKSARPQAVSVFEAWYKKHARTYLAERLEFFSRNYGFEMKRVRISSAHKRWGSCSAQGTLSFTWRLVKAPPEVIDYVVVHELCHLRELNHSRKFWALVESILPEYKISRMWLKQYGEKLSL